MRQIELMPRNLVAKRLGLSGQDFTLLVDRGILPGASKENLWSWQRVEARRLTLRKAQARIGLVYVVGFGPYVKIGFTAMTTVQSRIASLQPGCPEPLQLFGEIVGTHLDEIRLQGRFREWRTIGDWFRKTGDLADWIGAGCPR